MLESMLYVVYDQLMLFLTVSFQKNAKYVYTGSNRYRRAKPPNTLTTYIL